MTRNPVVKKRPLFGPRIGIIDNLTYSTNRMQANSQALTPTGRTTLFRKMQHQYEAIIVAVDSSTQLIYQKMSAILPSSDDPRRQHLQEIASTDEVLEMSDTEKEARLRIKVASLACLLTGIGVSYHPISLLFAAPLFAYTLSTNYRDGIEALRLTECDRSQIGVA